jgi:hypothetical protein
MLSIPVEVDDELALAPAAVKREPDELRNAGDDLRLRLSGSAGTKQKSVSVYS